jgi:hypothetical protein
MIFCVLISKEENLGFKKTDPFILFLLLIFRIDKFIKFNFLIL